MRFGEGEKAYVQISWGLRRDFGCVSIRIDGIPQSTVHFVELPHDTRLCAYGLGVVKEEISKSVVLLGWTPSKDLLNVQVDSLAGGAQRGNRHPDKLVRCARRATTEGHRFAHE